MLLKTHDTPELYTIIPYTKDFNKLDFFVLVDNIYKKSDKERNIPTLKSTGEKEKVYKNPETIRIPYSKYIFFIADTIVFYTFLLNFILLIFRESADRTLKERFETVMDSPLRGTFSNLLIKKPQIVSTSLSLKSVRKYELNSSNVVRASII